MSRKRKALTAKERSANAARAVEFTLEASEAKQVLLAGAFTRWDERGIPLQRDEHGLWRARLELPPGRHEYKFLVDGQWCDDPRAGARVANCFGSNNCVIEVA